MPIMNFLEHHPHAAGITAGLLVGLIILTRSVRWRPANVKADNFSATGKGCTFDLAVDGEAFAMEYHWFPRENKAILTLDGRRVASCGFETNGCRTFQFVLTPRGGKLAFRCQFAYQRFQTNYAYKAAFWCNGKLFYTGNI